MKNIILVLIAACVAALTQLEELDLKIKDVEARLQAIKYLSEYQERMGVQALANSDIEQTLRLARDAQVKQIVPEKKSEKSLQNLIFLRSSIESDFSIFGVTPVRSFRSEFNTVVSHLTIIANDSGLQAFDSDGNMISVLAYSFDNPQLLVKAPHPNEMTFTVTTDTKLVQFKLKVQPQTKVLTMAPDWQQNLTDLNITSGIKQVVTSRQKGRYRISILDTQNNLTTVGKDGKFEERLQLQQDVVRVKNMNVALAVQLTKTLTFKNFKSGVEETITNCATYSTIVDFAIQNTGNLYVLGDRQDLTVFQLNQASHTCIALGKVSLDNPATRIYIAGAMLILAGEDGNLQAFQIGGNDIQNFFQQRATQLKSPCDFEQAEAVEEFLVLNCGIYYPNIAKSMRDVYRVPKLNIITMQSTLKLPTTEPGFQETLMQYIPQIIFFCALIGCGWWQYRKITKSKETKLEAKATRAERHLDRTDPGFRNLPKSVNASDSDDDRKQFIAKNRQVVGGLGKTAPPNKAKFEELQNQIKDMEGKFGSELNGMFSKLQGLKSKTGHIESELQSKLKQSASLSSQLQQSDSD